MFRDSIDFSLDVVVCRAAADKGCFVEVGNRYRNGITLHSFGVKWQARGFAQRHGESTTVNGPLKDVDWWTVKAFIDRELRVSHLDFIKWNIYCWVVCVLCILKVNYSHKICKMSKERSFIRFLVLNFDQAMEDTLSICPC